LAAERLRGASGHPGSDDADHLTDNPNQRCPIIDKARQELGCELEVSLEVGLERALSWYLDEQGG
jgi:UDP-glucuronate decarboxylase